MHIVILIYSFGAGGAERVTSLLLEELSKRYKVTLVLLEDICHYDIPSNVDKIILGNNNSNENGILKFIKIIPLAYKYSKIIKNATHSLSLMNRPNYINILSLFFSPKAKIFVSERCFPSKQYGSNDISSRINKFLIRLLYNKAYSVSANSMHSVDDLITNFGIHKDNVLFLPNIFDLQKIKELSSQSDSFRDKILEAKNNNEVIFVSIGRLDHGKNHELLIESIKKIRELGYKVHLFIIGGGILEDRLNEISNSFDFITLLGKTKNPYASLAESDFFLFGSRYEGFPNVLVEAISLGIPVITTDCAPDVILGEKITNINTKLQFSKCGITVPIDDQDSMVEAIKWALDNSYHFSKETILEHSTSFDKSQKILEYKKWLEID